MIASVFFSLFLHYFLIPYPFSLSRLVSLFILLILISCFSVGGHYRLAALRCI
jgi:hypothetical protein